jgi:hypothetical protein
VIIARSDVVTAPFTDLRSDLTAALHRLQSGRSASA